MVESIFEVSSERGGCTIPNGFAGVEDGVIGVRLSGKNLGMIGHFFWLGA